MKPFRKHLAIAIDGGGIRGVMVTKALSLVEEKLGFPFHSRIELAAGTSTGSIIAAGLAAGLEAKAMNQLYLGLGTKIFPKSLRTLLWPFFNYRYPSRPLEAALSQYLGNKTLGDLWSAKLQTDLVITVFDVVENRTLFLKPYKPAYEGWSLVKAVLASSAAPTYFPSVEGRYVDGGVGSYGNPCYLAAYEIMFVLGWPLEETTLISLGTGRDPNTIQPGEVNHFLPVQYVTPLIDAFSRSAADQQVDLVRRLFPRLDFRRFQVDLRKVIPMDDVSSLPELVQRGEELGEKILNDEMDRAQAKVLELIPGIKESTLRRRMSKSDSPRPSPAHTSAKSVRAPRKR